WLARAACRQKRAGWVVTRFRDAARAPRMHPQVTIARRFWRITEAILVWTGAGLWFLGLALWQHFAYTRAGSPDPAEGHIYALNTHGSVAYLSASERLELWFLRGVPWALAL